MTVNLESLSAHLDREPSGEDRALVEQHVADCADCRAAVDVWQRASTVLRSTSVVTPRRIPFRAATAALVVLILIAGSAAAVAAGLFNEIFHFENVSAVASRPVSMSEARVTGLPLPTSDEIGSDWRIRQVYLIRTPSWSSVDVQYSRPRSVGMGIKITSEPIGGPTGVAEVFTTSGTDVAVIYERHDSAGEVVVWARFAHQGSWVEIRGSGRDLDRFEIAKIVDDWMRQARK